jgi:hypothetical protein
MRCNFFLDVNVRIPILHIVTFYRFLLNFYLAVSRAQTSILLQKEQGHTRGGGGWKDQREGREWLENQPVSTVVSWER